MSVAALMASQHLFFTCEPLLRLPGAFRMYHWHRLCVELTQNHNYSLIYTDGLQITVVCALRGSLSLHSNCPSELTKKRGLARLYILQL